MFLGCHLSTSGGYTAMGKTAVSIGADTFQFFTRNPRGGAVKRPSDEDVAGLIQLMKEHQFGPLVAHAPYTLNPCAAENRIREFTEMAMSDDLENLKRVPGTLYNFHPGSHVGQGIEKGIELIIDMLDRISDPSNPTVILLETMSGKGSEVGSRFEEIAEIISKVKHPEVLGVCMDSCHVYSAGYDVAGRLDDVLTEFDQVIGLDRLKAVHLNDSMMPFESHKDRHECIGKGTLGFDAVKRMTRHEKLKNLPFVLETPNELPGYAEEIRLLRAE